MPDRGESGLLRSRGLSRQIRTVRGLTEIVEETGWTEGFSAREVGALCRYVRAYEVPAGTTIVREGDREGFLCLVAKGRVNVVKGGRQIHSVGPGRTFGEMSLFDGEPRSASVVAEVPSTIVVLNEAGLALIVEGEPRLAVKVLLQVIKLTSQRLRLASGKLVGPLLS